MRPAAEVDPIALAIEGHLFFRDLFQDGNLVVLAHGPEQLDGPGPRHLLALNSQIRRRQFVHTGLDPLELFRSEGRHSLKIIVKTILDGWSDRHLGAGEKALDRLSHQVGC